MRIALLAVAGAALLSSCAMSHSDQRSGATGRQAELEVTVSTGIDAGQAEIQVLNRPVAQFFPDAGKVVYVSGGLYSSTCPPRGTATQDGETITLTVRDSDDNCTADAVRDTFQIEQVTSDPSRLVIEQAGQPDIRMDLSS